MSHAFESFVARSRRNVRGLLVAATLGVFALPAQAASVTYNWVPNAGQFGSGSLTISDPGIVDPANFSGIPVGALIGLSYTWNNGVSVNLASVATVNTAGWQACAGYLINGFTITGTTPHQFQLANSAGQCFPNFPTPGNTFVLAGPASNNLQSNGIYTSEINAGTWQLAPQTVVPVPAAVWLMGSGLLALGGLRRRAAG